MEEDRISFQANRISDSSYEFKISFLEESVGTAYVVKKGDEKGEFWHLDNLEVKEGMRGQGFGSKLLQNLIEQLNKIKILRIRVHPAVGQQVMEKVFNDMQSLSEEELNKRDIELMESFQEPGF